MPTNSSRFGSVDGATLAMFRQAVEQGDSRALETMLSGDQQLRALVDEPLFSFGKPAVVLAAAKGDRETIRILLRFGADIDRLSDWGPGGFGVLHSTCFDHPELAAWLVERGAHVDVHAAAGLGDRERLRDLLTKDPESIHRRGPDGQLPLHFAADVATAELLLDHGAELDARCLDHDSTAAQWMIQRAPEVSRYLVERGAQADIFLAVALDDEPLVRRLVAENPACLRARLGRPGYDPVPPGNILCWTLGWWAAGGRASPHRIARAKGDRALYRWLLEASPPDVRLMVHAWHGEKREALRLVEEDPGLVERLEAEDRRFLADAAWDGRIDAVGILLAAGFDPHIRGDHGSTPLDRAAFHGFADVIELLLKHDPQPPLETRNEFGGTPLGTLIYGSWHGWRDDGDYPRAARLLVEAGAPIAPHAVEQARDDVRAVLSSFVDRPAGRSRRHTADESPVDDASLGALELIFDPNPTDIHEHPIHTHDESGLGEKPSVWIWYYRAEILNRSQRPLRLVWMEAFYFEHGFWFPGNGRGRAIGPEVIRELYCKGDLSTDCVLPPGGRAVRPIAWLTGEGPVRSPVKWAVLGIDEAGGEHYAETEIRTVPHTP